MMPMCRVRRLALIAALLATAPAPVAIAQSPQPDPTARPAQGSKRPDTAARRMQAGNIVGHGGPVKTIKVDIATGVALTGSFDYTMMVWDVSEETPRRLHRLDQHDGAVNAVAFVPGTRRALAAGDDGKVAVWDLGTGTLVHRFEGHAGKIVGLAISADGRWAASAGWDRTARLWDLAALKPGPVLGPHQGPVNAVAFLRDNRRIATAAADGTIGLYDVADGSFVRPLHRHGWGVNVLERLAGEAEHLVFGAINGAAGIINAESGEVTELRSAERPILALSTLEKPGLIATGDGSGTIRVFRAGDGALIEEYQNPTGPVWALAFLAAGARLYYGGLDDFVTLWQIAPRAAFEPVDGDFPRRFQLGASGRTGDVLAEGELQFARKCSVCHTLKRDDANRAGPTLYQIFGRRIGSLPGYPYSEALKKLDIVWGEETIGKLFELGPDALTPGSKMPLQKMTDTRQREALIAFLKVASAEPSVDGSRGEAQNSTPKGDGDKK